MEIVTIKPLYHKNANRLGVYFSYNEELIRLVRTLSEARWSRTLSCWHIANTPDNLKALYKFLDGKVIINNNFYSNRKQRESELRINESGLGSEKIRKIDLFRFLTGLLKCYVSITKHTSQKFGYLKVKNRPKSIQKGVWRRF